MLEYGLAFVFEDQDQINQPSQNLMASSTVIKNELDTDNEVEDRQCIQGSGKGMMERVGDLSKIVVRGTMHHCGVGAAMNVPPLQFSSPNMTVVMTVKSCVPRTAPLMSQIGAFSGFMTKRNEQMKWQNRFCVLVPHTFLYYFDSKEADTPRGIIDLEYYTNIHIDDDGVIHLGSSKDIPLRTFHFKVEGDETEANEWVAALHRERHSVLKEERDAYKGLQDMFSSTINQTTETIAATETEKEQAKGQLAAEQQLIAQYCTQIHSLLADLGLNPELTGQREDMGEALRMLKELVVESTKPPQEDVSAKKREEALRKELEIMKEKMKSMAQLLGQEKELVASLKAEVESLHEDKMALGAAVGEHAMNLSIVAGEKQNAEQKVTELIAEKKLLIREVKLTRKALAESRTVNERLATSYQTLEMHLKESSCLGPSQIQSPTEHEQSGNFAPTEERLAFHDNLTGFVKSSFGDIQITSPPNGKRERIPSSIADRKSSFSSVNSEFPGASTSPALTVSQSISFLSGKLAIGRSSSDGKMKPTLTLADEEHDGTKSEAGSFQDEAGERAVLRCKRCKGTVEGPVFSTCKCMEPKLDDEEDTTASRKISQIVSRLGFGSGPK